MKCPKCGFVSHDYLDACRKCSIDLVDFKAQMNLRVLQPGALDLTVALAGVATNHKANSADLFSNQMLVQSDESLEETNDNFDISLDDDFSAFDPDQIERIRSGESSTASADIPFDFSQTDETAPHHPEAELAPPTTGYATVMIDVSSMDGMFDDENDAATTTQADPPSAADLTHDEGETIAPNTGMLHLQDHLDPDPTSLDFDDTTEALDPNTMALDFDDAADAMAADTIALDLNDTSDSSATPIDAMAETDPPALVETASLDPDDTVILDMSTPETLADIDAEPANPSKDISLPHTAEQTLVLGDLAAFGRTTEIDTTADTVADIDSAEVAPTAETIVDAEAIELSTPSTAAYTPIEIDLEPDEASAANPTASLEIAAPTPEAEMDLSELDFDLEPDFLHFDSQETEDLELSFMSTDAPRPPLPPVQDADDTTLEFDDFDLEDDEQSST